MENAGNISITSPPASVDRSGMYRGVCGLQLLIFLIQQILFTKTYTLVLDIKTMQKMEEILEHPLCGLSKEDQHRLKVLAPELDALGRFPEETVDIIARNNHFHLFVPVRRGGLDYSLVRGMRVIESYARIEGNLGWIVQIGAGGGVFSAYMEEGVSDLFLSRPDQVIAGSDFVGGSAYLTENGYRVSGEWRYASGSLHATAFTANCRIMEGPEKDQVKAIIVPADQVEIIRNWNAMGMRATDSHSFRMADVMVPESHLFAVSPVHLQVHTRTTKLPFLLFARALFMPVLTGIAYDYMILTREYLRERNDPGDMQFAKSWKHLNKTVKKSRTALFQMANRMWSNTPTQNQHAEKDRQFGDSCICITTELIRSIDQVHRHTGMKGVRMDEPLNVAYRNIKTAAAHHLFNPSSLLS